jgi:hypothetical protein
VPDTSLSLLWSFFSYRFALKNMYNNDVYENSVIVETNKIQTCVVYFQETHKPKRKSVCEVGCRQLVCCFGAKLLCLGSIYGVLFWSVLYCDLWVISRWHM